MARTPDGPPPPPAVQRLRLRYAKRGRLRFSSHRDFQRALERALRRAAVPMAYSAGFTPHPKISFANAAPTGTASEAELVEIAVVERCDPEALRLALDEALPPGLDVLEVVEARPGALADRLEASVWQVVLPGADPAAVAHAVETFLAQESVTVERLTKSGPRALDARAPVVDLTATTVDGHPALHLVVRHVTPTIRPEEILGGLRSVAGLVPAEAPRATRLAQGPLQGLTVGDPLAPDRDPAAPVGALPA